LKMFSTSGGRLSTNGKEKKVGI